MFASQTTTTEPVPNEPGQTVTFQKLSGKDFEATQFAHMTGVATGRGRNWATTFVRMAAAGTATDADAKKVLSDPLSGFDRLELAKRGVKAWSFMENGKPKPVTPKAIEDVDDERLEWMATVVLKLTKPELFLTAEQREEARKNGSGLSTAI